MNHLHYKEIPSTQEELTKNKELLKKHTLLSCEVQTNGKGQYERKWDSYSDTLCLSFTLTPNEVLTLTSLEVGCIIHKYFLETYGINLQMKWPNDILNLDGQKVGGIIINKIEKLMAVGVGLNYLKNECKKDYKTPYGHILSDLKIFDKKSESKTLYEYILQNRLDADEVRVYWTKYCFHINKIIHFCDGKIDKKGLFLGIGEHGQAIVQFENETIKHLYSGSVRI